MAEFSSNLPRLYLLKFIILWVLCGSENLGFFNVPDDSGVQPGLGTTGLFLRGRD